MRLIDADELKEMGATCFARRNENGELEAIISIDNAPTVEPETKLVANVTFDKEQVEELVEKAKADILAQIERPQGEWEKCQNDMFRCSKCRQADEVPTAMGVPIYNFCPNCGARMGGTT